uniref:ubiquitinyl hydrolase 1 n=2 Tax=Arion vulgaris TaxID=1028688 RepID=A0A0B7A0Q1_9EUPU
MFSSPRLAGLKLIYGDLTASRVHELKDQCKKDIAAANGLENESYAEAIQRLSDLEWLIYKQANDTLIDSLFTGQLVEAYYGVNHGSISVNLQTFNVLPVPIGDAVNFSGLVMLDDCFSRFCNIENLNEVSANGPDKVGFNSDQQQPTRHMSQVPRHTNVRHVGAAPFTQHNFKLAQESGMNYLPSPIHPSAVPFQAVSSSTSGPFISHTYPISPPPQSFIRDNIANDSGFLDNTFRTSTPVARDSVASQRQGKIQRRCLLRQLPECLIIQLMRFKYDPVAGAATKVTTSVSIRLRDFNLRDVIYDTVMQRSDMTAPNAGYVYELYGLCLHLGADITSHGHYVSYCLERGRWYRMDDQNVHEVNMEYQLNSEEIRQNAYILFYRRITTCA